MNKLFVYGIFLGEAMRNEYGMTNPRYATVKNFLTVGGQIVWALPVDPKYNCCLTGLLVDMDPAKWEELDRLEGGYTREIIETTDKTKAYMYIGN